MIQYWNTLILEHLNRHIKIYRLIYKQRRTSIMSSLSMNNVQRKTSMDCLLNTSIKLCSLGIIFLMTFFKLDILEQIVEVFQYWNILYRWRSSCDLLGPLMIQYKCSNIRVFQYWSGSLHIIYFYINIIFY